MITGLPPREPPPSLRLPQVRPQHRRWTRRGGRPCRARPRPSVSTSTSAASHGCRSTSPPQRAVKEEGGSPQTNTLSSGNRDRGRGVYRSLTVGAPHSGREVCEEKRQIDNRSCCHCLRSLFVQPAESHERVCFPQQKKSTGSLRYLSRSEVPAGNCERRNGGLLVQVAVSAEGVPCVETETARTGNRGDAPSSKTYQEGWGSQCVPTPSTQALLPRYGFLLLSFPSFDRLQQKGA
mmetsp:Transcript_17804/g.36171  ORF Transcript_17804/g.36171 Transcript_17804/m.36171 type:complete len:236 (+) Transcript_17804:830-1537(+)